VPEQTVAVRGLLRTGGDNIVIARDGEETPTPHVFKPATLKFPELVIIA
jgi:hypothetical protein